MKGMKSFFMCLIAISMVLSLVACDKNDIVPKILEKPQTSNKDVLTMAIGSEPDGGFDPVLGWGRYGSPLIQSTLVETTADMEIVGDLATDYNISEDGVTWTFNLRDDARFTDGEKVTAQDVVFTYEKAKVSNSIVDLTVMESIKATDASTVEIMLAHPESAFIYSIAKTGIVPEHAYNESYGDNPIGSGPYKFVQWDKGQQLILEANKDYYGHVPEIKKVVILFMSEDAAVVAAKADELDVAMTIPSLAIDIDGMSIYAAETIDNRGITLPVVPDEGKTTKEGYPIGNDVTSDIDIRKALSYGLDREQMVEDVLNGHGVPAFTEADGMPWFNEAAVVEYDLEKAKQMLTDGGWVDVDNDGIIEKDGLKAEFTIIYSAGDSVRQGLAMAVSMQAKKLGISINVEGMSWDEIDKRMFRDPVLMGWGDQTPMESYLLYHSSNKGIDYYNPENYGNETVDKYVDEALRSTDVEVANELWKKAQWDGTTGTSTLGDAPWVWLVNVDHLYYIKGGLEMGEQKIHPHGHAWPLISNLREWKWVE
jgi:peptide/nickel transport system substrate-binding protein